jgi:hypothetical protein
VNPTHSSSVGEVFNEGRKLRLSVEVWEESSFELAISNSQPQPDRSEPDWENIEAVGAADDAARFQVFDLPLAAYAPT